MKRRNFLQVSSAIPFAAPLALNACTNSSVESPAYKHSVCRWCFSNTPLEQMAERVHDLGIHSIELLHPEEWKVVQKYGLECAIGYANDWGLTKGFNNKNLHAQLLKDYTRVIPLAAEDGIPQVISFSGNANGLSYEEGLENCAKGLEPVLKIAERYDVMIVMELLNSRLDHPDYQCDHTEWGVRLVEKLGSTHFKLLYDIYHMQIMEGDIIATISHNKDYIGHFHTAGVPGRHELDQTQELNYSAIVKAISANGFDGFIAQEFIPTWEDPYKALENAINICSV